MKKYSLCRFTIAIFKVTFQVVLYPKEIKSMSNDQ